MKQEIVVWKTLPLYASIPLLQSAPYTFDYEANLMDFLVFHTFFIARFSLCLGSANFTLMFVCLVYATAFSNTH
jgi:hypothetical protein